MATCQAPGCQNTARQKQLYCGHHSSEYRLNYFLNRQWGACHGCDGAYPRATRFLQQGHRITTAAGTRVFVPYDSSIRDRINTAIAQHYKRHVSDNKNHQYSFGYSMSKVQGFCVLCHGLVLDYEYHD